MWSPVSITFWCISCESSMLQRFSAEYREFQPVQLLFQLD